VRNKRLRGGDFIVVRVIRILEAQHLALKDKEGGKKEKKIVFSLQWVGQSGKFEFVGFTNEGRSYPFGERKGGGSGLVDLLGGAKERD